MSAIKKRLSECSERRFLIKSIFSSIFLGKKGKKAPLINIRNYL